MEICVVQVYTILKFVKIVLDFRIFSFLSVVDCSGANPCLNGGTCDTDACTCAAGFNGALCNTVDCSGANPCLNGGTCDTDACTCAAGFNGALCNTVDCSGANPCLNGGTCDTDACTCAAGINGALCNIVKPTATTKSAGYFSVAKDNKGRPLIGHCLTDHVIKTVPAKTMLRCAAECIQEVGCKSINYKDGVCELNEETRASALSSYFSQNDGCSYYELI
ncbi:sushi, nidogen and EGF-like domain-containing protein 1 [Strongylocentrotus purpuratus]|uniref:Uncharacterized protein n=1 Tax=Strongylocentrotus purpuratus TaxID=7668 RepID=A0A7M7NVF9_STRPU|nr:sushi, nidogen and EGF-like domain-containing protein 1 [Strongylocentrotus purpuratus]